MGSIYDLPTWSIVGCILFLTFIANEIGFRFGWQDRARESDGSRAVSNGLKASILGLAALLLGFSFSTTSTKHYQRQRLVLDEANAIGTCYLRTDLLEAPHSLEMQQGLKRFTEQRLRFFEFGLDPAVSTETLQEMDRELDQLWQTCSAATREQSDRMLVSQIVPSLNEVIDLNEHVVPTLSRRLIVLISTGVFVVCFAIFYVQYFMLRPIGSGPVGPDVPAEPFDEIWTEQRVVLLGLGDSITAGLGADSQDHTFFNRLVANPADEFDDMQGKSLSQVIPQLEATNLAVSGSTSKEHSRLIEDRLPQYDPDVFGIVVMT
ncbi:unnamed protein product, partial [Symbiodinium microadriaticum]